MLAKVSVGQQLVADQEGTSGRFRRPRREVTDRWDRKLKINESRRRLNDHWDRAARVMDSSDETEWELSGADRKLAVGKKSKYNGSQENRMERGKGRQVQRRLALMESVLAFLDLC